MLKKLYECEECGVKVPIRSKKKCNWCRSKELPNKHYQYNKKLTQKQRRKTEYKKEIMKIYWDFHLKNIKKNPFCENCGCKLRGEVANIAHILPKQKHTSVMDNLDNCLYLCSPFDFENKDCHNKFDKIQTIPKVYLMPVWKKAVEKYLLFKDNCEEISKYTQNFENWINEESK